MVGVVWTVRLVSMHYTANQFTNWGSDQVGAQNLVANLQRGFTQAPTGLAPDTYFLKYPLYFVVGNLPIGPLKQVFVESWVLLMLTAALVLRSCELLFVDIDKRLTKSGDTWLAMVTVSVILAATPLVNFYWLEFPNARNIEIGLVLYLITRAYLYLAHEDGPVSRWRHLAFVVAAACLFCDDPLTLYGVAAPVIAVVAYYAVFTIVPQPGSSQPTAASSKLRRSGWVILAGAVAAALSEGLGRVIALALDLQIFPVSDQVVPASLFLSNLAYLVSTGVTIFGLAPWGLGPTGTGLWSVAAYGLLLAAGVAGIVAMWRRYPGEVLGAFLGVTCLWLFLLFLVVEDGVGGANRFLSVCEVFVTVGAGLTVLSARNVRLRNAVVVLAVLALGLVVVNSVQPLVGQRVHPDVAEVATVAEIEALHLRKGYAEYWDAGIDRYLSHYSLDITNVECGSGAKPSFSNVWSNEGLITQVKASKSFYVLSSTDSSVCSLEQLESAFGKPARIVPVGSPSDPTKIVIYNYDIGRRILAPQA